MYDETSIRILTEEEKQTHSADSILFILLDEYPDTSSEHLARVAECLVTFGWGTDDYAAYRAGTMDDVKRQTINAWFTERNRMRCWH
ncbi:TPA: hypothetical protein GF933_10990 [Escherichia coli]|nr:hypothetical protein [Escherichia coli]